MSFKIPNSLPTRRSSSEEWSDYAEYLVLKSRNEVKLKSLFRVDALVSDELDVNGIEDDSDELTEKEEDLVSELNRRIDLLTEKYPFELDSNGYILRLKSTMGSHALIYKFLLFSTRLNMTANKIQNGLDGTLIFEKLSSIAIQNYFGQRSRSYVFGTSTSGGFNEKLKELIRLTGEGGIPNIHTGTRPQDDGLDIIVWNNFKDRKGSKIIGFGQCKTGTDWSEQLERLNPLNFGHSWFSVQPLVTPIKFFCTSQYFPTEYWNTKGRSAGIIFDRFRLLECIEAELPSDLSQEINNWTTGAEAFIR